MSGVCKTAGAVSSTVSVRLRSGRRSLLNRVCKSLRRPTQCLKLRCPPSLWNCCCNFNTTDPSLHRFLQAVGWGRCGRRSRHETARSPTPTPLPMLPFFIIVAPCRSGIWFCYTPSLFYGLLLVLLSPRDLGPSGAPGWLSATPFTKSQLMRCLRSCG